MGIGRPARLGAPGELVSFHGAFLFTVDPQLSLGSLPRALVEGPALSIVEG